VKENNLNIWKISIVSSMTQRLKTMKPRTELCLDSNDLLTARN
jgi:hypothetical protein